MKKIIQRATAQTPPFFRKIRNVGLVLTALATAVVTIPVSLPALVITISGYAAAAGAAATAISQLTLYEEPLDWQKEQEQ
ncbi:hypothetical protein JZU71_03030 [bacterium]|nr:hypothetical protein [bacterium]